MNVELVEVFREMNVSHQGISESRQQFSLRKVFVNPEHIVCMRIDDMMNQRLCEGLLPADLDDRQGFTKLYINRGQSGLDVTVVGKPSLIQKKIEEAVSKQKTLLKG